MLLKAQGKCTTDHISAAGPWLKYRGHLENISGNLYLGAINAYTGEAGTGKDPLDGETRPYPEIAKRLHEAGVGWVAIGDENMGEGSSREHAAMEPRFRNAKVILSRSFARIHETNLKKQGLLPLTFADPATYDQIGEDDTISVHGLADLAPDTPVRCTINKPDGTTVDFLRQPDVQPRADRLVPGRRRPQHHPPEAARLSSRVSRCRAGGRPRRPWSPLYPAGYVRASSSGVGVRFLRASGGSSFEMADMIFLVSASGDLPCRPVDRRADPDRDRRRVARGRARSAGARCGATPSRCPTARRGSPARRSWRRAGPRPSAP